MLCECRESDCASIVLIGRERYEELRETGFFTAPGHAIDDAEPTLREGDYWLHRPVGHSSSPSRAHT
jgi:hypothetical protein